MFKVYFMVYKGVTTCCTSRKVTPHGAMCGGCIKLP